MTNDLDSALDDARRASSSSTGFLDQLMARLGATRAETVFGNPVEAAGVTVIPVAKVNWGGGGGGGKGNKAG